jgi:signal transduction histidine kinase
VRLVPGDLPAGFSEGWSPVLAVLIAAWICVLVASGAVAALLLGAVSLSERRAAFVSAVTHEMRTPLTTFLLYTEMLGEDMVQGEDKRRRYLATLRAEAQRLAHLVENVLGYARLEQGRPAGRLETVRLGDLVDGAAERLRTRAAQAGMDLLVDLPEAVRPEAVKADPSAVEQVLLNLVDNACKYAAGAEDRRIHLEAARAGGRIALSVRDHGPGVARDVRGRLFRPFSKSAQDAANSAPGVGLGLALSRRLARGMGGDLRLAASGAGGASFVLVLAPA